MREVLTRSSIYCVGSVLPTFWNPDSNSRAANPRPATGCDGSDNNDKISYQIKPQAMARCS
jgi:hypothetical protein